jgi:hypothetical protein
MQDNALLIPSKVTHGISGGWRNLSKIAVTARLLILRTRVKYIHRDTVYRADALFPVVNRIQKCRMALLGNPWSIRLA